MRSRVGITWLKSAAAFVFLFCLVSSPAPALDVESDGVSPASERPPIFRPALGSPQAGHALRLRPHQPRKSDLSNKSSPSKRPFRSGLAALSELKTAQPDSGAPEPEPSALPQDDEGALPGLPGETSVDRNLHDLSPTDGNGAVDRPSPLSPEGATLPVEAPAPTAAPAMLLPQLNAALKALLEARVEVDAKAPGGAARRHESEAVAAFYTARDFAPLWSRDGQANVEVASVLARLGRAAEDGLDLRGMSLAFSAVGAADEVAAADIALSEAVVAYGRQASGARVDPHMIAPSIGARPEVADPSVILANVANAGSEAGDTLKAFNPPQKPYEALRGKLAEMRRDRPLAARASIPTGPTLKIGMRDPRVPLIRARLSLDEQKGAGVEDLVYDAKVATAVADFQKANGLPASGRLTAQTIAVLSGGQRSQLEAEILANMERWRWMPRDMGENRIEVNIPDYEVVVVENGQVVERHRVVVGKEDTPTAIFSNRMQFLIVNPYWNVPQSIIKKEMMPKLAADPNYLHRLGYQTIWRGGKLTVRQPPGERNALGRIKFMFPNDYAVYLHDTPSKALFSEEKRAFSHGCVRVDDPFRFAQTVLGKGWSEDRVKGLIGGKERYIYLPKPLPVHLEYFTAYVDEAGRLQMRNDIYGYSRRVKAALGLES
jgi:murein L,D-transpeptidase YcbB/YkuD